MKALTITNESVTREALLEMAERIPGAWIGIRIAAMLLLLEGWKSSRIARLFGLTRWCQWESKSVPISGIEKCTTHPLGGCYLNR